MIRRPSGLLVPPEHGIRHTEACNLMGFGGMMMAGATASYTTLDAANKNAGITLSTDLLTASHSAAATHQGVRSIASKTSGKWYLEFTPTLGANTNLFVGVVDPGWVTINGRYVGIDVSSWAAAITNIPGGNIAYHNASGSLYGPQPASSGVVWSMLLDMDVGTLKYWYGGVDQGVAFSSGLTSPLYAAVSLYQAADTVTVNFGASPFTYSPPAGYTGWTA